jgi:hypothetical protein
MPRRPFPPLAAVLALVLAGATAKAADPADDAREIAVKLTTAGAAMFDARDAKGLALTYNGDARLEIISKDKNSGELKTDTRVGRTEIEAYYAELFKSDTALHARNTVEFARRIDPDLLLISGVFEPNTESADPMKLPFVQVRTRQDGAWRIVSLQLFFVPQK